jgi:hypothetical protein
MIELTRIAFCVQFLLYIIMRKVMKLPNLEKIIIFNGPPRSGKDTAGQICKSFFGDRVTLVKFTTPIKNATHIEYGIDCDPEQFEETKDTPNNLFNGLTPRQAYTNVSSDLKKKYGPYYVANLLACEVRKIKTPFIVNTDAGYDFEALTLQEILGCDNTLLIRIHREGKSFIDDCREMITLDGSQNIDIVNEDRDKFDHDLKSIISDFLRPMPVMHN